MNMQVLARKRIYFSVTIWFANTAFWILVAGFNRIGMNDARTISDWFWVLFFGLYVIQVIPYWLFLDKNFKEKRAGNIALLFFMPVLILLGTMDLVYIWRNHVFEKLDEEPNVTNLWAAVLCASILTSGRSRRPHVGAALKRDLIWSLERHEFKYYIENQGAGSGTGAMPQACLEIDDAEVPSL